jgi:hypothetical protein
LIIDYTFWLGSFLIERITSLRVTVTGRLEASAPPNNDDILAILSLRCRDLAFSRMSARLATYGQFFEIGEVPNFTNGAQI